MCNSHFLTRHKILFLAPIVSARERAAGGKYFMSEHNESKSKDQMEPSLAQGMAKKWIFLY